MYMLYVNLISITRHVSRIAILGISCSSLLCISLVIDMQEWAYLGGSAFKHVKLANHCFPMVQTKNRIYRKSNDNQSADQKMSFLSFHVWSSDLLTFLFYPISDRLVPWGRIIWCKHTVGQIIQFWSLNISFLFIFVEIIVVKLIKLVVIRLRIDYNI